MRPAANDYRTIDPPLLFRGADVHVLLSQELLRVFRRGKPIFILVAGRETRPPITAWRSTIDTGWESAPGPP